MANTDKPTVAQISKSLDIQLTQIPSKALARLIEEVRNHPKTTTVAGTAYNRTYHRHNR